MEGGIRLVGFLIPLSLFGSARLHGGLWLMARILRMLGARKQVHAALAAG